MTSFGTIDKVEEDIRDGYVKSRSIGNVSKVEEMYDNAVDLGGSIPDSGPIAFIKEFYDQNQDIIKATATGLASLTSEGVAIENAVDTFTETTKVIIKGLDALAQIHPAIGGTVTSEAGVIDSHLSPVAVIAFKLVIIFDMTRRENNKKVLALKIEMQDMMTVLFELRHIRDPMDIGPDGSQLGSRIQGLMSTIANDIKDAGSVCDAYLKKGFLARTLKSKIYETRLAECGSKFENNKTDIQRCLTMHTTRGVDLANEKLDAQQVKIDEISSKFDRVLSQLDSPQEREIQRFIQEHGGAQKCIENEELLSQLLSRSGHSTLGDLRGIQRTLLDEFHEDVEKMFESHSVVFHGKLDIQSKQLEAIQTILTSGSHDEIIDPVLKTIWKEMGWKRTVEARHFVLAVCDHFNDTPSTLVRSGSDSEMPQHSLFLPEDRWVLSFLNVTNNAHSILEAIDEDASGFVSIKEVNTFVTSAPGDWSLSQRLAFWAAGWHLSIVKYKVKIQGIVQRIFQLQDYVLPANRVILEGYLFSVPLLRIQHILRLTGPIEGFEYDRELFELVDIYEETEAERLTNNLASVAYELDSQETVNLVTGPGRIERYLLPLLNILLERHLRVLMLACKYVLCESEMKGALWCLRYLFRVVDERVGKIAAIFKQNHFDVNARLGTFAFGMFQLYYETLYDRGERQLIISKSVLGLSTLQADDDYNGLQGIQDEIDSIPLTELKLGIFYLDIPDELDYFQVSSTAVDNAIPLGCWSGHLWVMGRNREMEPFGGLMMIQIDGDSDGRISGKGRAGTKMLTLKGTIDLDNSLKFTSSFGSGYPREYTGKFDPGRQTITASCRARHLLHERDTLSLCRTPNHLHHFRAELIETEQQKSLTRRRWAFACAAILHEVRRKSWSWSYLKARIGEVRRFVELETRNLKGSGKGYPDTMLSSEEMKELRSLRNYTPTQLSHICGVLTEFNLNRLLVCHGVTCTSCKGTIYEARHICLVCIEDTDNPPDTLDLCRLCLTASTDYKAFRHNPYHSMLKYEHTLRDVKQIWSSHSVVARAKAALREVQMSIPDKAEEKDRVDVLDLTELISCVVCANFVTVPCWICHSCPFDIFICSECEEKRVPLPEDHPFHKLHHPIIRIGSFDPDLPVSPNESKIEVKSTAVEKTIDTTQFESRVEERLTKIEDRLTQLEVRMQDKLSVMEGLLRQMLARTDGGLELN